MASKVSISNLALGALGHKAIIQSMTEQSQEATFANLFYEQARKATLRAHPWNFANIRVDLALLGDGPRPWAYQYALPTNCVRALYIQSLLDNGEKIPFEVSLKADGTARVINTNQPDATLIYTANVEDPNLFDPMFTEAFVLKLAGMLAPTIAPQRNQEMATRFVNAMRAATAVDAGEGEPEPPATTDWLEARLGYAPRSPWGRE